MTGGARAVRAWLGVAGAVALLAAFLLSIAPFVQFGPGIDSLGALWQWKEIPARCWLFDPLCASYVYVFFFEPAYTLLHAPALVLAPAIGVPAYHAAGVAGVVVLAATLGGMVFELGRSSRLALAAAALISLSFPSWVSVADTSWCHYPWASAFGLLAVRPFFLGWWRREPVGVGAALVSAAAYGIGLSLKESVATMPALGALLALDARIPWRTIVLRLAPHAGILALFVAWRVHVLGGLGGYFFAPEWVPSNVWRAAPVLFELTWSAPWLIAALAAGLALRAPRAAFLGALAFFVASAPFVMAYPIQTAPTYGPRLLLPLALFLLFAAACLTRAPSRRVTFGWVSATALLLVCAGIRHGAVEPPPLSPAVPQVPWTRPVALVSEEWISFAFLHHLSDAPGAPLFAYRTAGDVALGRALGLEIPGDALRLELPDGDARPTLVPFEGDGVTLEIDGRGRVRLRSARLPGNLRLGLLYRNGGVRWVASFPVGRRRIDFPLTPSIERVVLFEPRPDGRWPAKVVPSPFFRSPYP